VGRRARGWRVACAAPAFALLLSGAAAAQPGGAADRASEAHHAGLKTGALAFPPPGHLQVALGLEYLPDVTNDLAGVRGELARIPTLGLILGLAGNASFHVSWPAYNRLRVHDQEQPARLGHDLGEVSTGWGDVTVATLIELRAADGARPGCGLRFAATLPNSSEELGIGDNTTDVFASVLLASRPAPPLGVFADLGLGILSDRTAAFTQNDVFTYGVLADWAATEELRLVGEVAGRASTHAASPGTESRSELRAGIEMGRGTLRGSALLLRGLSGWDSRGVGVSVNVSTRVAVLKPR
jgi:hypothetical protein